MELTPRYDTPGFLRIEVPLDDPAGLVMRQRRRLEALARGLDDEQWAGATRCDRWSARDVIAHLVSVNQFWVFSIGAALGGDRRGS